MDHNSHGGGDEPEFLSTHDEGNARILNIIRGQCRGFEEDENFLAMLSSSAATILPSPHSFAAAFTAAV